MYAMTDPTPNHAQTFWTKRARRYAARPIADMAAYEATLDRVRAHLTSEDKALELGCGTASTALRLSPFVARYTATDYSAGMVEIGQGKAGAEGADNLTVLQAGAEDAIPGGPFDVVLAFNLLHLVDDLPGTLRAMGANLKPGGRLITKTPCIKGRMPLIRMVLPVMRLLGLAPRVAIFDTADLRRAIVQAGFEIVETGNYPDSPPNHFVVAKKA